MNNSTINDASSTATILLTATDGFSALVCLVAVSLVFGFRRHKKFVFPEYEPVFVFGVFSAEKMLNELRT